MEDVDPCELPFSVAPHVVLLDQAGQGPAMRYPFVDAGEAPPSTIAAPIDFPDTGAIVALIDRDDCHHDILRQVFEEDPGAWVLPWAVLPEVDHIVSSRLGPSVGKAFRSDLSQGLFSVEWGEREDLIRARELDEAYGDLKLGLVDGVVMAIAERLGARAIATLDLRDFAAVQLAERPELWPRDLPLPGG